MRHILVAQALSPSTRSFGGRGDDELTAMADSFALEACVTRTRLCELLASRTGTAAGQA